MESEDMGGILRETVAVGRLGLRRVHEVQSQDDLALLVSGDDVEAVSVVPPVRLPPAVLDFLEWLQWLRRIGGESADQRRHCDKRVHEGTHSANTVLFDSLPQGRALGTPVPLLDVFSASRIVLG